MSRLLMVDIGAGTMDVLYYDTAKEQHYKFVAPSPVRLLGVQIENTPGPLVVDGVEMGGGPVTEALIKRAAQAEVVISKAAAATLHHNPEKVRSWGLQVADSARLEACLADPTYRPLTLGDVQVRNLRQVIQGMGLSPDLDIVALCAQDHGVAPPGVSHLDFRHNLFLSYLKDAPQPHKLLFRSDEIPEAFNRLRSMARTAEDLGADEIFVMDSGMAAMVGASQDMQARHKSPILVLDIATSHTVAAIMEDDEVAGFLEYHTHDITCSRLENLIRELAEGRLDHHQILAQGGHGAFVRHGVGLDKLKAIIATGPKRGLAADARLPLSWGAPWGDNMMTGTVGLLESVRRRKGLDTISYV